MTKRVAIYARVSTTRQAKNDISIPDQIAHAKRYCEQKEWIVVGEFVDAASARDDKRPQLQALLDAACSDASPIDIVMVHSQSRFFRDTVGFIGTKRKLQKHGVSLISITQDFGESESADVIENIFAVMDEYQSRENAKHVKRTMLENASQGFWNGSAPPFGYRTIGVEQRGQRLKKHLEIEPKAAELVRLVFKLFEEGDGKQGPMGVKAIASWLNARGYRTSRGKLFYTGTIHLVLTREAYTGVYQYNTHDSRTGKERPKEEWIAIPVPQIIPPEQFKRVQARLALRRPEVTAPRIVNSPVLLSGLALCDSCGGAMMLSTGKGGRYRYYTCANRRTKGREACKNPITVSMGDLDKRVVGALADQLLIPERLSELLRAATRHDRALKSGNAQRRSALRKQQSELQRKIGNMHDAIASGLAHDTPLFRENLHRLEDQHDETCRLLSQLEIEPRSFRRALSKAQAQVLAAKLKQSLIEAPPPLQRRYLHGLVAQIVVDKEKAIISGPKAAIAAAITQGTYQTEVPSFVREWRTR